MPKDKRQIKLDPMEWRDAMKKVAPSPSPKKTPAKITPASKTKTVTKTKVTATAKKGQR